MTKQESFKRRVRTRMQKTGERYAAARRALVAGSPKRRRTWVSEPDLGDDAISKATGRDWDAWCDLIDAWPGHTEGHTAIATYVREELGIDGWWAQGVTVGYERITGIRLRYQRPDGTFTASKSRTVAADATSLSSMLRNPEDHADLFPGQVTDLRSKDSAKTIRIGFDEGVALLSITPAQGGRCKVSVEHAKLSTPDAAERWRFYWGEWLEALDSEPIERLDR